MERKTLSARKTSARCFFARINLLLNFFACLSGHVEKKATEKLNFFPNSIDKSFFM